MRYASIDVGLKRIGIAISLDGKIIFPQNPIFRKNRNQASRDLREFLKEWQIGKLIVGIPFDGSSEDEMKLRIEHFVKLLDFDKEVIFVDESFSSFEAKQMSKGHFRHKKMVN